MIRDNHVQTGISVEHICYHHSRMEHQEDAPGMMVVEMNKIVVEVIGARNDYKVEFETWEDAEKYCDENKYYFNNASVFITQGDRCKAFDYRKI